MILSYIRLKNIFLSVIVLCFTTSFIALNTNLSYSKTTISVGIQKTNGIENQNDNISSVYYTDNFDGNNSVASLRSRGYVIKKNGSGGYYFPGDPIFPAWFTGNTNVFNSYNGPASGYVSSNYGSTLRMGILDNWLILPRLTVTIGDSICFYARGFFGIDSITVMYSASGDTNVATPFISSPNWVVIGRFKAVPSGQPGYWEYKAFAAPTSGINARFAIRNYIHNAGMIAPNSDWIGIDGLTVHSNPITLNIKLISQGFYNISDNQMRIRDTVRAYLRNKTSPFAVVDSALAVIDSVTLTGNFIFEHAPAGSYYIRIKHRNLIETWSKAGGETYLRGTYNYDFTNSASKAFGNNMINIDNLPARFAIYSGDVNQDGTVDLSDLNAIYNASISFATGYLSTDLTGDGVVDLSDLNIAYNNSIGFVSVIKP